MRWRRFWIGRNRETERRRDGGETRSLLSFSVSQYHFLVAGRTVAVSHCVLGGVRGGAGDVVRSLAAVVVRRVLFLLWAVANKGEKKPFGVPLTLGMGLTL